MNKVSTYATQEPVRVSASILVLGAAIIGLLSFTLNWDGEVVALVGGIWAALIGTVESFIVRGKVVPVDSSTSG